MIRVKIIVLAQVMFLASGCPNTIATVHIQNHDGPIYVTPDRLPCDNQMTINQSNDCCDTCGNQLTHCNQPSCDGIQPTCNGNLLTHSGNLPTYTCGNQSPILHSSLPTYPVYEHDCKCVSKQVNPVPINMVPQNGCLGYCQPGAYPDYSAYRYYYPEGYGSEGTCPLVSEGLIPLLKSYLGQSKCPKHCSLCGQSC